MSSSSLLTLVRYCIDLVLGVPSKLGFWIYFVKKVFKFVIRFNVNRIKELTIWEKKKKKKSDCIRFFFFFFVRARVCVSF